MYVQEQAPGVASSELYAKYGQCHGWSETKCAVVALTLLSAPQMLCGDVSQNIMKKDDLSRDSMVRSVP